MAECRKLTEHIPSTPLLVQVWRDTPEGSSIRKLLLSWAAEYMRSSDARAEFAKSLPQEVLSELVVAMSSFEAAQRQGAQQQPAQSTSPLLVLNQSAEPPRKNVNYLDEQPSDEEGFTTVKKLRRLSGQPGSGTIIARTPDVALSAPKATRTPLPKPTRRRTGTAHSENRTYTTAQKLDFCADLLTRMLSGPGQ